MESYTLMSRIEPGRGSFCGPVAAGAAANGAAVIAEAGAEGRAAALSSAAAWPNASAKNAFWAASRAASCDGPAVDVGVRAVGRIGVKGQPDHG